MNKYQTRFVESVLKKAIDGTYTKSKACLKTGYSRPYLYELVEKYKKDGYQSSIHKNTRRAPINKTDFYKILLKIFVSNINFLEIINTFYDFNFLF